jgi:hypothetical protein
VLAQLRLSIPSHRAVVATFILSLPRRVGVVSAIHASRCALRLLLLYRIVQHTIHMHAYRIVSYNILSNAHTCRCYGFESYHSTNKCMSYIILQPCTHTTTEKANPFFTSPNRAGGWAFSKSFPLRVYGFKIDI